MLILIKYTIITILKHGDFKMKNLELLNQINVALADIDKEILARDIGWAFDCKNEVSRFFSSTHHDNFVKEKKELIDKVGGLQ